jgi:hypothetical protein
MGDAHLSLAMMSSERDLMIDGTLSVSSIRKFLKLWAFGAGWGFLAFDVCTHGAGRG